MSSDSFFSGLSAWLAVAGLPISLAGLGLTDRGSRFLSSTTRWSLTALQPSRGHCWTRGWTDVDDGPLHVCMQPSWQTACHNKPHTPGAQCWNTGLFMILNNWKTGRATSEVEKPRSLPLGKEFLLIDCNVLLAYIFMAAKKEDWFPEHKTRRAHKNKYEVVGAVLDIQTIAPGTVVLHMEGSFVNQLTKDYMTRLIKGFPPLRHDPLNSSIFEKGDEARGGWVVALGLQEPYEEKDAFFPVYTDCVSYKDRRGHVFWRSMDRVRLIVTEIWATAFADDPLASAEVELILKALQHIHVHETESGVNQFVGTQRPSTALSDQERLKIIKHFNSPPLIAASQKQQFQAEWTPLLRHVLVAAVTGSIRCIAYFKNPGREIEGILPVEELESADIFLRTC